MTETATNPTEGQPASQPADTQASASADAQGASTTTQQATEGQTPEGQPAEGGKTESDQAAAPGAYEFKAPEGREFDPGVIGTFTEVAKELNLSQDAAQKILDKMAPVIESRQVEAIETAKTQWAETARTDKEFGGEKLTENLAVAKKALDAFGSPELRTLLNESGLGNHPEVIRLMYRAGKAISEDGFVPGGRSSVAPADPAKRLFPNQA